MTKVALLTVKELRVKGTNQLACLPAKQALTAACPRVALAALRVSRGRPAHIAQEAGCAHRGDPHTPPRRQAAPTAAHPASEDTDVPHVQEDTSPRLCGWLMVSWGPPPPGISGNQLPFLPSPSG